MNYDRRHVSFRNTSKNPPSAYGTMRSSDLVVGGYKPPDQVNLSDSFRTATKVTNLSDTPNRNNTHAFPEENSNDDDDDDDDDDEDEEDDSPPVQEKQTFTEKRTEKRNESTFNIDKVTLECMMNKNLYKKYLAQTDTDKYQQMQVQSRRLAAVRAPVLEMTRQLIDDYVRYGNSKQYTHKIHASFEAFIDLCMTYVAEHPPGSEHDDVDVLFDPRKMKG